MARVERGNVVLHVDDKDIDYYVNMGYNVTDEAGNILKQAIPNSIGVLQTYYLEHLRRIAELEDTVARLTAELQTKKRKTAKE